MPNLKCDAINCASNRDNCCCQPAIKVQGKSSTCCEETRCQSFSEKGQGEVSNSTCFCEPNCDCTVKCTASQCGHNSKGDCTADCVCIDGRGATEQSQTACNSFEARQGWFKESGSGRIRVGIKLTPPPYILLQKCPKVITRANEQTNQAGADRPHIMYKSWKFIHNTHHNSNNTNRLMHKILCKRPKKHIYINILAKRLDIYYI